MVRPHGKRPDPHRPPRDHWASSRWARATISSRSTTKASDGSGEIEPFPRIESNNEAHSFFPAGNVLAYYQRAAGSDQNPGYLDHVVGRRARATAFLGDTVPRADSVVLSRHAGSRTLRTSPAGTRFTCSPIRDQAGEPSSPDVESANPFGHAMAKSSLPQRQRNLGGARDLGSDVRSRNTAKALRRPLRRRARRQRKPNLQLLPRRPALPPRPADRPVEPAPCRGELVRELNERVPTGR